MPTDQADPLGQLVQTLRRLQQHDPGTVDQLGSQRQDRIAAGQPEPPRVVCPSQLSGQRVGVAADAGAAEPGSGAERQCAVPIADHHDLARPSLGKRGSGGVQQQPVGGIDGVQVRRLDVRKPAQRRQVEPTKSRHDDGANSPTGQLTPVASTGQYPYGFLARYCWW